MTSSAQAPDALVHTKFRLPSIRTNLVDRPRLKEQLLQGLTGPLSLVIAPAGFGKTTLVASCVSACPFPVAWLSLDKDDNELERFLRYVVAALQTVNGTIGARALELLLSSRQPASTEILTSLINDIDALGNDLALVLDDYRFITSPSVHQTVAYLIEHCPHNFHLLVATRFDPPLPLARLRALGRAAEIRAAELSFTESETARFLNRVMGLCLDVRSVSRLNERTEGWIAGLQMAALSLRNREDIPAFIEAFSGSHRYILDYLLEEVLAGQPPEVQRFLLHTSILERLSAPLCDALLVEVGEPLVNGASASLLEYLERSNLFLVALDDERLWYRYHHLFSDLLRAQLSRNIGEKAVAQLHLRAASWHEKNGSVLEAIHHASLAADECMVERLIEESYIDMVRRGEMAGLNFWKGRLSHELVLSRPQLCLYEAYSHSWFGELDEAEALLDAAEKHPAAGPVTPETESLQAHLLYIRSRVTAMRGDLARAIEINSRARRYLPASNIALQLDMGITLGYLYFLGGDYEHACHFLEETIQSGRNVGAVLNTVAGYCLLARLYANRGILKRSFEIYEQASKWIEEIGGQHLGACSLVELGRAETLCEWNQLDAALAHVEQSLKSMHLWAKADDAVLMHATASRIHLARGDMSAASASIQKASGIVETRGLFPEAPRALEYARVRLWLQQGDLQAAAAWKALLQARLQSVDPLAYENELVQLARARVLMAGNQTGQALDLLSVLHAPALAAGRAGRVIEILMLRALALQQAGDCETALQVLSDCLSLAEPQGYARLFLEAGSPMRSLLAQWVARSVPGGLRDYAQRLLSAFGDKLPNPPLAQKVVPAQDALVEPLSQRELEVLHLLALGHTNQEIACQLVVAAGTVKAHTASIYRKLQAANRTEAVARARDLGVLS